MKAEGAALVTGAGRGLGRALAVELARRGFEVHATLRDPGRAEGLREAAAAAGVEIAVERLDVCDPDSIALPGNLRVLVNNAGVDKPNLPVEHAPMELWREMFETNVFGLVEVTRRAVPLLRASGGGVICNLSSVSVLSPVPFYAAYRASKAAVGALSESLRSEVAGFGIRVIEVMPGPVETDMLEASDKLPEAARFEGYAELAENLWKGRRAVGPMAAPATDAARDIADAILDDASPVRVPCDPLSAAQLGALPR